MDAGLSVNICLNIYTYIPELCSLRGPRNSDATDAFRSGF